jgi:hypothetical protein
MSSDCTHSLTRTNRKGVPFIGRCVLCGLTDLPAEAVQWRCSNPRGVSNEQAVVDAVKGCAADE